MRFDLSQHYKLGPYGFLGKLPGGVVMDYEPAQILIVPFGHEGTVTLGRGTASGPQALIKASYQVETFDDELLDDVQNQIKFWTIPQPDIPDDPQKACLILKDVVKKIIDVQKFPVVIGGEHTISFGFAQGLNDKYKDISILSFDAHMDLEDRMSERSFTHASWLKYSLNLPNVKTATLVGIRNFNKIEWEFCQNNKDNQNGSQ